MLHNVVTKICLYVTILLVVGFVVLPKKGCTIVKTAEKAHHMNNVMKLLLASDFQIIIIINNYLVNVIESF